MGIVVVNTICEPVSGMLCHKSLLCSTLCSFFRYYVRSIIVLLSRSRCIIARWIKSFLLSWSSFTLILLKLCCDQFHFLHFPAMVVHALMLCYSFLTKKFPFKFVKIWSLCLLGFAWLFLLNLSVALNAWIQFVKGIVFFNFDFKDIHKLNSDYSIWLLHLNIVLGGFILIWQ